MGEAQWLFWPRAARAPYTVHQPPEPLTHPADPSKATGFLMSLHCSALSYTAVGAECTHATCVEITGLELQIEESQDKDTPSGPSKATGFYTLQCTIIILTRDLPIAQLCSDRSPLQLASHVSSTHLGWSSWGRFSLNWELVSCIFFVIVCGGETQLWCGQGTEVLNAPP